MKIYYLSPAALFGVLLGISVPLHGAIETTSATDSGATASVAGDLLESSLSSSNWPSGNNINNGSTGAFNEDSEVNPAVITSPASYDFNLDLTTHASGYDISEINCYTGWVDGRAGQTYTLFFSFVGDPGFTQITPTTVNVAASGESLVTQTRDNTGGLLGSGVDAIRFVVGEDPLSNVWREIDVIGVAAASGITRFVSTPSTIAPGAPVTLSWEVGNLTTSTSIEPDIGEVSALTDANGIGSITLNPGPLTSESYTLSATLPNRIEQASTFVEVTSNPIILSFTADLGIVDSGSPVNLSWEVANAASLFLNDIEVTGLTGMTVSPAGQSPYLLTATNESGSVIAERTLYALSPGGVIISEFLASNDSSFVDEDGDDSDWIELHNPTASTASLGGYYLTDDPADLQKWSFPATTLLPGEFLVVFASSKDRALSGSELHTNFSLSAGGEYLALVEPDGTTIATEFAPEYPEQRTDISYGYDFTEFGYRFFLEPTPGATNGESLLGFVEEVNFSIGRGFYESPFSVALTTLTEGASIRYTLDGSEPDQVGGLLSGPEPIAINATTVLRAAAFRSGFLESSIATQTYLFPADVLTQPTMRPEVVNDPVLGPQLIDSLNSIPTIALSFEGDDIDRNEIPLSVELLNFEGGSRQLNAGVVRFGSFNTNFEKRSFRLHFRSRYGASRLNFPLFEGHDYRIPAVESFDSLDIRAGNHDMVLRGAYLGNRFTDDSMIEMGHVAPHGRFVHIYFNGQYRGQYHLRERWDADMLASYLPGEEEEFDTINANNAGREFRTGDLQNGDLDEWNEIQARLVSTPRFEEVKELLDLNNYIDFMLLFTYGTCESEFRAGGSSSNGVGFKFFLKDADGFLQPPNGNNIPSGGFYPATHNGPLNAMTLLRDEADPDFMSLLADRIHRQYFNNGVLTPAESSFRLTQRIEESRLSYIAEVARWESHFGRTIRTPEEWEAYHNFFIETEFPELTDQRIDLLQAAGMYPDIVAPSYSQQGGTLASDGLLSLSVPSTVSQVYYLFGPADTDPSPYRNSLDPRLSGGGLNPLANGINFEPVGGAVNLIDTGAEWNFLDDGSNQATAWRELGFDDSPWSTGVSPLGYGDAHQTTIVSFGPDPANRHTTTYFRRTFNIDDPSIFQSLDLAVLRDDGIVVYLNGIEVLRDNLPTGPVLSSTFASSAIGGASETTFLERTIDASFLQMGENIVAVEIHQASPTSSDITLDLRLTANPPVEDTFRSIDLNLDQPGWLLSRSFNSSTGEWSALNEAFFTLARVPADASNLVISKIHYNPADPSGGELAVTTDNDDFEFLELMNVGNEIISLAGVTISGGLSFTFGDLNDLSPGGRLIVVRNRAAFEARYAATLSSIVFASDAEGGSEYVGGLSNGGEQLVITDNASVIIRDFSYDDRLPWPPAADGGGFSLVLKNPAIPVPDHGIAINWAASAEVGGAPGRGSDFGFIGEPLADNDGDGLVALLEYALGSSDSIANDSTITATFADFLVGEESAEYLTVSFLRNLHSQNSIQIIPEISSDLNFWKIAPDILLVSESDNGDGTSTLIYRSSTPISESEEGREFIRILITP